MTIEFPAGFKIMERSGAAYRRVKLTEPLVVPIPERMRHGVDKEETVPRTALIPQEARAAQRGARVAALAASGKVRQAERPI